MFAHSGTTAMQTHPELRGRAARGFFEVNVSKHTKRLPVLEATFYQNTRYAG